jgi:putative DNA primase/helicase
MSKRSHRIDQTQALLYHARAATPFCSEDGEPCASIPSTMDSRRVLALRSASFRDWLTANFYGEYETAPSTNAFRAALRMLEARARYGEMPAQKVDRRISFEGDPFTPSRIILDLANAAGEVLEISSIGWQTTGNLRHPFHESDTTLALPSPDSSPSSQPLEQFAEIFRLTGDNRTRAFTWLATALRPIGPYPVLVLRGPAASGKSVLARALRALIDPSTVPLRRLPARDREILHLALQNWILVFDQVYRIPAKVTEALCALSSGDALEVGRADRDPLVRELARPLILIAPTDETHAAWTPPRTLSNRTLTIDLPPITALRPEASLWAQLEALRPAILATFATAVATALRRIRDVDLGNVARFPDCAAWAAAAAPALALNPADITETFSDPNSMWAGSDPLREVIHDFLHDHGSWTGSATELLSQLRAFAPSAGLPATPKGLSQALPRVAGILVARKQDAPGDRVLTIRPTFDISAKTA